MSDLDSGEKKPFAEIDRFAEGSLDREAPKAGRDNHIRGQVPGVRQHGLRYFVGDAIFGMRRDEGPVEHVVDEVQRDVAECGMPRGPKTDVFLSTECRRAGLLRKIVGVQKSRLQR